MKKCLFVLVIFLCSVSARSQGSGVGIGLIAGEPTGLSIKVWTGQKTAVDAGAAWALIRGGFIRFHADALVHSFAPQVDKGELPLYFGVGGKVVLSDNLGAGIRIPLGIAYLFEAAPLDIFLEVVPTLELLPATDIGFEGGIGARFFF
jgi:hypothetical protein